MILEILGGKSIKVNGNVQVVYKTGENVIYISENTKHLIINPDEIVAITVGKKTEIK